jgi:DNA helicase-2/ATP-dependent DNA helicase PcrA
LHHSTRGNIHEEDGETVAVEYGVNSKRVKTTSYDLILNGLNEAQTQAVTTSLNSITRVIAGPGAGKTRVLTHRIAYLLKKDHSGSMHSTRNSRILAMTFTKKAASEMQVRLEALLREDEEYQKKAMNVDEKEDDQRWGHSSQGHDVREEEANVDGSGTSSVSSSNASLAMMNRVSLGTFHSICAKILRWNGSELDGLSSVQRFRSKDQDGAFVVLDGSFAIIDQSEQMRIIRECMAEKGISVKDGSGKGSNEIKTITILNAVCQLKSDDALENGNRSPANNDQDEEQEMGKKSSKIRKIAEEIYPLYRKKLIAQNSLDFDDIMLLTRELLMTNESVRERMSNRWKHILVDEFQDTSQVQLDIVGLLSRDSLLIVGDGDQSIYSWRGAHAESMTDFVHKFEKDKTKQVDTVYLMENYRSTTNIVKAAQKVIAPKSSKNTNATDRKDMKPMRGKGPSPRVVACSDAKAEATFVVKEIKKMVDENLIGPTSTVALIYRTNAQSRALEEACVQHNLKYLVRGSAGTFYTRVEIKDCLCFVKWLYNGRDKNAMIRAMKTPSRGLGDVSLNEFSTYCDEVARYVAVSDPDGIQPTPLDILLSLSTSEQGEGQLYIPTDGILTKRTLKNLLPFASQMKELQFKAHSETVAELLKSVIKTMDLRNHFDAISKTKDEFSDRWANVMELLNASERYNKDGPCMEKTIIEVDGETQVEELSPLGNFLDDVSLLTDVDASDEDEDSTNKSVMANLMTIHASKGMEFDAVFLVGNEESTFPTQKAIASGEGSVELEEERRLCYVAMTRAKTYLIMTWRKEVMRFYGTGFSVSPAEKSRFLDDLVANKGEDSDKTSKFSTTSKSSFQKFGKDPTKRTLPGKMSLRSPDEYKPKLLDNLNNAAKESDLYDRSAVKDMLKKRVESRQEAQKWASFHAKKKNPAATKRTFPSAPKDGTMATTSRRTTPRRAPPLPSSPSSPRPGGTTRGYQTLNERSTLRPKGNANVVRKRNDLPTGASSGAFVPAPNFDSTMFFPIGTNVKHIVHGEGSVVKPSPGHDSQNVNVQFDSGIKLDFPLYDNGLIVKYQSGESDS